MMVAQPSQDYDPTGTARTKLWLRLQRLRSLSFGQIPLPSKLHSLRHKPSLLLVMLRSLRTISTTGRPGLVVDHCFMHVAQPRHAVNCCLRALPLYALVSDVYPDSLLAKGVGALQVDCEWEQPAATSIEPRPACHARQALSANMCCRSPWAVTRFRMSAQPAFGSCLNVK